MARKPSRSRNQARRLIGTAPWGSAKSFTNFNTVCDIRVPRAQGELVKNFGHQQDA